MKKLFAEFKAFINKGNALALAIGVIIGSSFTAIVTAINKNIISPLIGALLGDSNLSESCITVLKYKTDAAGNILIDEATGEKVIANAIYWGTFFQAVIDFLLTAIILFAIFKITGWIMATAKKAADRAKARLEKEEEQVVEEVPAPAPAPKEPTIEEKQLALLEQINENLAKLNLNKE